ncbi:Putative uncharacterized protein [Halomonas sp. R57-5]|nr:Putative uncharacterized protein [Halomonas sp. R57-5]
MLGDDTLSKGGDLLWILNIDNHRVHVALASDGFLQRFHAPPGDDYGVAKRVEAKRKLTANA